MVFPSLQPFSTLLLKWRCIYEVSPQVELFQTSSAVYHCLSHTPSSCSLTCSCPFFTWVFTSQDSADWDAFLTSRSGLSFAGSCFWQSPFPAGCAIAWLVLGPTQLIGPGRHFRSAKPAGTGWQGGVRTDKVLGNKDCFVFLAPSLTCAYSTKYTHRFSTGILNHL